MADFPHHLFYINLHAQYKCILIKVYKNIFEIFFLLIQSLYLKGIKSCTWWAIGNDHMTRWIKSFVMYKYVVKIKDCGIIFC